MQQRDAEIDRLRRLLEQFQRSSKRQAAPFSRGQPKEHPKKPGRKAGRKHGKHGHRAVPQHVDEVLEAPLPDACPECGGKIRETHIEPQYQEEIPCRPLVHQFNIHFGECQDCGCHCQGRHPLQTSNAVGAAASQVGPDAQAAVVYLNKRAGLSHGKIAHTFRTLFGIHLSRGARRKSCSEPVSACGRPTRKSRSISSSPKSLPRMKPAGGSAVTRSGFTLGPVSMAPPAIASTRSVVRRRCKVLSVSIGRARWSTMAGPVTTSSIRPVINNARPTCYAAPRRWNKPRVAGTSCSRARSSVCSRSRCRSATPSPKSRPTTTRVGASSRSSPSAYSISRPNPAR